MSATAPLASRSCELRPVSAADTDWLYTLLVHDRGSRWRYRGTTPSPASFAADLWHGIHSQFVVCDLDARPCGIVGFYNANIAASHARFFAVAAHGRGAVVTEGAGVAIEWAFEEFDFDKLWLEVPEFNLAQFSGLHDVAEVEAQLRNHDFWRGRFWDLFIVSIGRARWGEVMRHRVEARRRPLGYAEGAAVEFGVIEEFIAECWPMDSLATVELITIVEEALDRPVGAELVAGLDGVDAAEVTIAVLARVAALVEAAPTL